MRNHIGGWAATYDSCMAQRAIVDYAVLRGFEIGKYSIRLNFTSSSSADLNQELITIDDSNIIETRVHDIENTWGVAFVDGFGNGYPLLQVSHLNYSNWLKIRRRKFL